MPRPGAVLPVVLLPDQKGVIIGCGTAYSDENKEKETKMKDKHLDYVMGVVEASELWGLSAGYIKNLCATGEVEALSLIHI